MSEPTGWRRARRSLLSLFGVASSTEVQQLRNIVQNGLQEIEGAVHETTRQSESEILRQLAATLDEMRGRWREEDELILFLVRRARTEIEHLKILRARPEETNARLAELRDSPEYLQAWEEDHPLVSVRIASYQDTASLIERAIPSVLAQTHQNFELIIVNDGPNERTREAVSAICDPRIRYVEFPERSRYPEDPHLRWMVAGSPGMNQGAQLAVGQWIAPLDDDDEFTPDHIEKLLRLARSERAEFVYGSIEQHRLAHGDKVRIFSDPPAIGQISMQAALYHSGLRFMEYDTQSWLVDEPGDWNLIRRMYEAGVRMAAVEDVVTTVYMLPFDQKGSAHNEEFEPK